jgi:hypothetical protein
MRDMGDRKRRHGKIMGDILGDILGDMETKKETLRNYGRQKGDKRDIYGDKGDIL